MLIKHKLIDEPFNPKAVNFIGISERSGGAPRYSAYIACPDGRLYGPATDKKEEAETHVEMLMTRINNELASIQECLDCQGGGAIQHPGVSEPHLIVCSVCSGRGIKRKERLT